jgi:phage terminase small subunit
MPRRSTADRETPRFELVLTTPLDLPGPPAHLSEPTQQWWRAIVSAYDFQPHHLRLLEAAAGAWDRAEQARETVQREGLTIATKHGRRTHPCVNIERDAKLVFMRALTELDLDVDGPRVETYSRPPGLRSNRRFDPCR